MADPITSTENFLGITVTPDDVRLQDFFHSPTPGVAQVGSTGSAAIARRRAADVGSFLEFQDRMNEINRGRAARVEGVSAIQELSQLDPRDPDYLNKRNIIASKYPNSLFDKTVTNFLGLQEDQYRQQEEERRHQQLLEEQRREERRQEKIYQRKQDAEEARSIFNTVATFDPANKEMFDKAVAGGADLRTAFNAANHMEAETKRRFELQKMGATEEDIVRTPDGSIDFEASFFELNRKEKLRQQQLSTEKGREKIKEEANWLRKNLEDVQEQLEKVNDVSTYYENEDIRKAQSAALEAEAKRWKDAIAKVDALLGYGSGNTEFPTIEPIDLGSTGGSVSGPAGSSAGATAPVNEIIDGLSPSSEYPDY